jgi:hypothetical protein
MGRANALAKKHNDTDLQNLITEITKWLSSNKIKY